KGNLTQDPTRKAIYQWDDENRMRSSVTKAVTTTYRYDALGRRVAQATGGIETVYVCAGAQVVSEYINGTESQHYVYATYVDDPIALIKPNDEKYYYHSNHLFSVEAITDGNGDLVETYTYDAYGALEIHDSLGQSQGTVSTIGNAYGFTGRRLDQASGLWYFRARYYDDQLGRFVGRDSSMALRKNGYGFPGPLTGYHNGGSLYSAYFVPIMADPSGNIVIVITVSEAAGDDPEFSPAGEDGHFYGAIEDFNNEMKQFSDLLDKTSDAQFDKMAKEGKVAYNGEPFMGTREEYLDKVMREKIEEYIQRGGGLEGTGDFVDEIMRDVCTKDHDEVVLFWHTVHIERMEGHSGAEVNLAGDEYADERDAISNGIALRNCLTQLLKYCDNRKLMVDRVKIPKSGPKGRPAWKPITSMPCFKSSTPFFGPFRRNTHVKGRTASGHQS
ncbi:MAG: RHS repeat-associated core domain-containing protein, partial [Chloroflexota bacterium]|nr:RHS repeat-associated core domain-containing protein [Chloroflexota bacterium]